jgi:hypothetical protein
LTTVLEPRPRVDRRRARPEPRQLRQHCLRGTGETRLHPHQALWRLIEFRPSNLMDALVASEPFDIVFCRNVRITSTPNPASRADRSIGDEAAACCSSATELHRLKLQFRLRGKTVYERL